MGAIRQIYTTGFWNVVSNHADGRDPAHFVQVLVSIPPGAFPIGKRFRATSSSILR
jgi:hypothetical protein